MLYIYQAVRQFEEQLASNVAVKSV